MLRQYELVDRVLAYDPQADEDLLNRAYVFSLQAHGSQLRASGDPYFSHPIEVAGILTELRLDAETIATGILHDTIEDTVATPAQIEKLFGAHVARLVDGVTKLSKIEGGLTANERAAENLRKFLLAMSDDIRVLLVKLADRLHNMRTLHFIPSEEKRRRIARETMDIYAPLAERIGLYGFMDELQALAFQQLEPEGYDTIVKRLDALRSGSGDMVARIASGIKLLLGTGGVEADVRGREKRPYSIWRKLQAHRIAFEQLPDVIAFRVVVPDIAAAYRALGLIHQRWQAVPGRFKDFISTPKRNGYRSLHTTVIHNERMRIEIQIRTAEMDREAEFGLAAHWAYKAGGDASAPARVAYPWLKDLLDAVDQAASPEEVLEHTRLAMFQDQVFAFTPKGELIQLPAGSCPVDFAYAVHTELGDTCVGAKVNGHVATLRTPLANGDTVEILRSKAQHPDPAWEGFVVSVKARAAVRRFVRQQQRAESLAIGRKLYDEVVGRLKLPLSEDAVDAALGRLEARRPDRAVPCAGEADRRRYRAARSGAAGVDRQPQAEAPRPGRIEGADVDHRPDARGRLQPCRLLPSDPGRPHRRRRPRGDGDRGPHASTVPISPMPTPTSAAANGSTCTGVTRPKPASPGCRRWCTTRPAASPR